jgi:hypothetical protein
MGAQKSGGREREKLKENASQEEELHAEHRIRGMKK